MSDADDLARIRAARDSPAAPRRRRPHHLAERGAGAGAGAARRRSHRGGVGPRRRHGGPGRGDATDSPGAPGSWARGSPRASRSARSMRDGGRIAGVGTAQGAVVTPLVINAAGPAAARVGRLAGVEVPVHPRRRHIFFTEPFPELPGAGAADHGPRERILFPEGDGAGAAQPGRRRGHRRGSRRSPWTGRGWRRRSTRRSIACRIIEKARIAGGWAGLRPLTPDDHAIIGWAPGAEGFFLAVGFGGHGFQHSPATGRYVAEWIVDGAPSMDLSLFAPTDSPPDGPSPTTRGPTPSKIARRGAPPPSDASPR